MVKLFCLTRCLTSRLTRIDIPLHISIVFSIISIVIALSAGCSPSSGGEEKRDNSNGNLPVGGNISNTPTDSYKPVIAADSEGKIYIGWEEATDASKKEIYLATSGDSGITFSNRMGLSDSYCEKPRPVSEDIRIAAGENNSIYLAWIDKWLSTPPSEIKFFISEGDDQTCDIVSNTFDYGRNAYSPQITLGSGERIHLVWTEDRSGQKEIFYRYSSDKGKNFSPPLNQDPDNISNTPSSDSSEPLLGVEGSLNVNLVWVEGLEGGREIKFSRSEDGGDNFNFHQSISDINIDSYCPAIATYGNGNIYIIYKADNSIYFTKWIPESYEFSDPGPISTGFTSPSCPEMVVSSNGVIYVVWEDKGGIWIAISSDHGYSFSAKDVSPSSGTSSSPEITVSSPYVNIVWVEEDVGGGDIYFSGSGDGGKTFSYPGNLSNSPGSSSSPVITTDGEKYVYIAWVEGDAGSMEIYFKREEFTNPIERSPAQFFDISGDGESDIVIGAPGKPQTNDTGKVYVILSDNLPQALQSGTNASLSPDLTLFSGSTDDQFGYAVAISGDVNGDGYADIITGAPYADDSSTDNGKVYIYFGGPPSLMDTNRDITIIGSEDNDNLGFSVSPAGDINGDGFYDIIIGAPLKYQSGIPYAGAAYIFYGGPSISNKPGYPDISIDDADIILKGENRHDRFGWAVSWAGDFNGDGYDDVIIGAPYADDVGNTRGRAYIYYGGESMDTTVDVTITGGANLDQLGYSLARAGDIDRDGYGDVTVGAPWAAGSGINRGKTYIIYGGGSVFQDINLEITTARITAINGAADYAFFGTSLGYTGDVNNDGYSDIVAGGKYSGFDSDFIGRSYAFFGGSYMTEIEENTPEVTFIGEEQTDRFGTAVAGAGDVDGDGFYDILLGAYLADDNGTDRGKVYLYPGSKLSPGDVKQVGDADAIFTGDVDNGQAGYSLYKLQTNY